MFAGSMLGLTAGGVFTLLLACACASDLRTRRIPNRLVLVTALFGVLFAFLSFPPLAALARVGGGMAAGLALWLPFWLLGWLGAGDVKLFAAAAAWLGAGLALEAAVVAAVVGALLSLGWLAWRRGVRGASSAVLLATFHPQRVAGRGAALDEPRRQLPYGVALAIGLAATAWFPAMFS